MGRSVAFVGENDRDHIEVDSDDGVIGEVSVHFVLPGASTPITLARSMDYQ